MRAYRLLITLLDAESKIDRTVAVPDHACFNDLHSIIQSVMGWMNIDDHTFYVEDLEIGPYETNEDEGVFDDLEVPISEFEGKDIEYGYMDRSVTVEWKGVIEDHPYRYVPLLLDHNGDRPANEDMEDKAVTLPFDGEAVANSLETWGVQGVLRDDAVTIGDDLRVGMMGLMTELFEEPLVFDHKELCPMVVSKRRDDVFGMTVSPEEVSGNPENYSVFQKGSMDVYASVYGKLREEHPGLPELPSFTDNDEMVFWLEATVGGKGLMDEFAHIEFHHFIDQLYSWAETNGFYFFSETGDDFGLDMDTVDELLQELEREDPEAYRKLMEAVKGMSGV